MATCNLINMIYQSVFFFWKTQENISYFDRNILEDIHVDLQQLILDNFRMILFYSDRYLFC